MGGSESRLEVSPDNEYPVEYKYPSRVEKVVQLPCIFREHIKTDGKQNRIVHDSKPCRELAVIGEPMSSVWFFLFLPLV